jgi:hypothetical protein
LVFTWPPKKRIVPDLSMQVKLTEANEGKMASVKQILAKFNTGKAKYKKY